MVNFLFYFIYLFFLGGGGITSFVPTQCSLVTFCTAKRSLQL